MADAFDSPINQTKVGAAILIACVVQTLGESDAALQRRFLDRVGKAYQDVRDQAGLDCLELLTWVREMLEADDFGTTLHH